MPPYAVVEVGDIDSTNNYARAHLGELAHGSVVQARTQTAGRGRWQRTWVSHLPGNLYLTLVLKPPGPIATLPLAGFSQLLAVCLCRVLEEAGIAATLKWPNDVLVEGRKLAGILAETVVEGTQLRGLLLGIGVNLNLDASTLAGISQPATSLGLLLGREVNVAPFREALLQAFFAHHNAFLRDGFPTIRQEYLRRFAFIGRNVEIRWPGGQADGEVLTVDDQGSLQLRTRSGTVQTVSLGEIFSPEATAGAA